VCITGFNYLITITTSPSCTSDEGDVVMVEANHYLDNAH